MKFVLTLDIPDAGDHSPRAHRHEIGAFLDQVKQQVGGTDRTAGVITKNVPFEQITVGAWEFLSEDPGDGQ